jgi:hypothetical protein
MFRLSCNSWILVVKIKGMQTCNCSRYTCINLDVYLINCSSQELPNPIRISWFETLGTSYHQANYKESITIN